MGTETEPGVIPRAIKQVFSYIEDVSLEKEKKTNKQKTIN